MTNNFKKQAAQKRSAVPQIDVESVKSTSPSTGNVIAVPSLPVAPVPPMPDTMPQPLSTVPPPPRLTIVDTTEAPMNRGFFMYPSRHRQVAKDLVYIEDRRPWEIIEDALEEYVVRHYGKEYKRR